MVTSTCTIQESTQVDPDRRIAEEVVKGNHQAYNQLIERYWGRIFARVYQLLGNREDAEEVTQDAFSKAYESLANFRWEASFSTWLYQIASNLARNRYWYWKRRRRDKGLSLDLPLTEDGLCLKDVLPDEEADPGDRMRWNEFQESVEDHLDRLPEAHREVMSMRLLDNLSYEEIGDTLSIPIGTVKSRIARARSCLSRSLGLRENENVHGYALELGRARS
jgi:RNA polymerase sigma-70 factor (ECF subfamily)